jgi:hypothetical protein
MREAPGIGALAELAAGPLAKTLAQAGFRRVSVEAQWSDVVAAEPSRLNDGTREALALGVRSLRGSGLRPVLLLDAWSSGPQQSFEGRLTEPAPAGTRSVHLDASTAAQAVPGRSGLDMLTGPRRPEVLFTRVDPAGVATLSRPLPVALEAGPQAMSTLSFAPFFRPRRADGTRSPEFEETMTGFLQFVSAAAGVVAREVGSDAFDLVLWNGAGSPFLDVNNYYEPPVDDGQGPVPGATLREILARSVSWLREPTHGLTRVGIADGLDGRRDAASGATTPAGIDALVRDVSAKGLAAPADFAALRGRALDALGLPNGVAGGMGWREGFSPTYDVLLPELALTAVLPGVLVRDLAPFTTLDATGNPHGRNTHPPDGPAPTVWLGALSLNTRFAQTRGLVPTPAVQFAVQQKAVLRALSAYVGTGVTAVDFYAPDLPELDLIDEANPSGGPVLEALQRFTAGFAGPDVVEPRRALELVLTTGCGGLQFRGDGTLAHPDLRDADVLAFFPFQVDASTFVASAYVMTRSLVTVYDPSLPPEDARRFDMPPQRFTLVLRGLDGRNAQARAVDPRTGAAVAVEVIGRSPQSLSLVVALTDSPRLITLKAP